MSSADLHLASLIERHLEGNLDADGRAELCGLIRESPQAMQLVREQADLSTILAEHFSGEEFTASTVDRILAARAGRDARPIDPARVVSARHRRPPSATRSRARSAPADPVRRETQFQRIGLVAAGLCALVGGILVVHELGQPTPVASILTDAEGTVTRGDREIAIADGSPVMAGDVIHVADSGHVDLAYADGTRLRLSSRTVATLEPSSDSASAGKRVHVQHGEVAAQVAKQPAGSPMVFTSDDAAASVNGDNLTFATATDGSRLDVTAGKVRLTRVSDGASIDVGNGEFGVVASGSELVAKSSKPTPKPEPALAGAQQKQANAKKRVLLLRQHPTDDPMVAARLEHLGYDLQIVSDSAAQAADANGMSLVVIPESVLASNVGTRFREVKVPVLCWESGLWGDLGESRAGAIIEKDASVVIADAKNPLALRFAGTGKVSNAPVHAALAMKNGKPQKGKIVVPPEQDPRAIGLFAFDAGQEMDQGFKAPARRAGFSLHGTAEGALSAEGWALFDAAVRWCAGDPQPPRK